MAHQPREHWYMDFNYTEWSTLKTPGKLRRDYCYDDVAFWNNYIPAVVFFNIYFKNKFNFMF